MLIIPAVGVKVRTQTKYLRSTDQVEKVKKLLVNAYRLVLFSVDQIFPHLNWKTSLTLAKSITEHRNIKKVK